MTFSPQIGRWPPDIKHCIAGVANASIALAADGRWDPLGWERQLRGDWIDPSGQFRQGRIPSDRTIRKVVDLFPGCAIKTWVKSPLWYLLAFEANQEAILFALDDLKGERRRFVWEELRENAPWSGTFRLESTVAAVNGLKDYETIDAFTALLAISKEARFMRQARLAFHSAVAVRDLFPIVACATPLFARWRQLAAILDQQVWSRPRWMEKDEWPGLQPERIVNEIEAELPRSPLRRFASGQHFLREAVSGFGARHRLMA